MRRRDVPALFALYTLGRCVRRRHRPARAAPSRSGPGGSAIGDERQRSSAGPRSTRTAAAPRAGKRLRQRERARRREITSHLISGVAPKTYTRVASLSTIVQNTNFVAAGQGAFLSIWTPFLRNNFGLCLAFGVALRLGPFTVFRLFGSFQCKFHIYCEIILYYNDTRDAGATQCIGNVVSVVERRRSAARMRRAGWGTPRVPRY